MNTILARYTDFNFLFALYFEYHFGTVYGPQVQANE